MKPNWIGERPTQRGEHWLLNVRPFTARSLVGKAAGPFFERGEQALI